MMLAGDRGLVLGTFGFERGLSSTASSGFGTVRDNYAVVIQSET